MKPSLRQTIEILRRHKGLWVNREALAAVGGARFGGRIEEARKLGYEIETRYHGPASQYRLMNEPAGPQYEACACGCGWQGTEPQAIRSSSGFVCPSCSQPLPQAMAADATTERALVEQVTLW